MMEGSRDAERVSRAGVTRIATRAASGQARNGPVHLQRRRAAVGQEETCGPESAVPCRHRRVWLLLSCLASAHRRASGSVHNPLALFTVAGSHALGFPLPNPPAAVGEPRNVAQPAPASNQFLAASVCRSIRSLWSTPTMSLR
jgi:hypothetical protein